ncbi:MAG: hypothetical protein VCG02_03205 [Verrucomicrobiota bacterium]
MSSLDAYAYPTPAEAHPVSGGAQVRKIKAAAERAPNIQVMTHTYGPANDFAKRLQLAIENSPGGIWLNRYAYLDDQKHEHVRARAGLVS